jgi:putative glutamine amidotransferase
MTLRRARPRIGIACSHEPFVLGGLGRLSHSAVFERYVDTLTSLVDCAPVLIPALDTRDPQAQVALAHDYASLLDGILLPGASSNVDPAYYGAHGRLPNEEYDSRRDVTVLPLVRTALVEAVPLFGICRGMQEINVALGGSLHRAVHERPGCIDHRSNKEVALTERYEQAHALRVVPGGWLDEVLRERGIDVAALRVNSLHAQAIDRPGSGVAVEATAPDGTVEALRVRSAPALMFGVQWHPEWHAESTPAYEALFQEFGRACARRVQSRGA